MENVLTYVAATGHPGAWTWPRAVVGYMTSGALSGYGTGLVLATMLFVAFVRTALGRAPQPVVVPARPHHEP